MEEVWVCRNPGHASASIATPQVVNAEGANEWWTQACDRDRTHWTCEEPRLNRSAALRLPVQDIERQVELTFGGDVSLAVATALTQRAFAIFRDTASAPESCQRPAGESNATAWEKMRKQYQPTPEQLQLEVSVETEGDVFRVWLFGGSGITLDFPRAEADDYTRSDGCWTQWVIVA